MVINIKKKIYHLVDYSPWPLLASVGVFGMVVGGFLFFLCCVVSLWYRKIGKFLYYLLIFMLIFYLFIYIFDNNLVILMADDRVLGMPVSCPSQIRSIENNTFVIRPETKPIEPSFLGGVYSFFSNILSCCYIPIKKIVWFPMEIFNYMFTEEYIIIEKKSFNDLKTELNSNENLLDRYKNSLTRSQLAAVNMDEARFKNELMIERLRFERDLENEIWSNIMKWKAYEYLNLYLEQITLEEFRNAVTFRSLVRDASLNIRFIDMNYLNQFYQLLKISFRVMENDINKCCEYLVQKGIDVNGLNNDYIKDLYRNEKRNEFNEMILSKRYDQHLEKMCRYLLSKFF